MTIRELFESPICALPRQRNSSLSLPNQLKQMHHAFAKEVARASDDAIMRELQAQLKIIRRSSELIQNATLAYLEGAPSRSFQEFSRAMEELRPWVERLMAPRNTIDPSYRMREVDTLADQERGAIFHVPFECRHLIKPQRYSISGWPSLYLGASLLVCWEEIGRPAFHKLSVAAFSTNDSVGILDFGYRPRVFIDLHERDGFFTEEQVVSYAMCWHLIAACSICVNHQGSAFVEEYIIPQLLLQWLRNDAPKIDGLRYFSTRVEQNSEAPRLAINYVFPVKTNEIKGHCSSLISKFKLTSPVPWVLLEGSEIELMSAPIVKEPHLISPSFPIKYHRTAFGELEQKLSAFPEAHILQ